MSFFINIYMIPQYGNVIGIVVQNNDPQKRGRVKVFIPYISLNLYDNWDNLNVDKSFNKLSDPYIKDVIDKIKDRLPWANCASPIIGEVGSSYYDSYNKKTLFGDDSSKTGDKPSVNNLPQVDDFDVEYDTNKYSKSAKGLFSIPKVGSKVWCFFENGNINHPVYFATAYDESDWGSIYSDADYPDTLENFSTNDKGSHSTTYQNKMTISQKGGIIEIINTDNNESIKISQYNGSFYIIGNDDTYEFNVNNKHTLTNNDDTLTIKGNQNTSIKNNKSIIIGGNINIVIEKNANVEIHGNLFANVNGNADITIEKSANIYAEEEINIESGGEMNITSGGIMTLQSPRIDLNP